MRTIIVSVMTGLVAAIMAVSVVLVFEGDDGPAPAPAATAAAVTEAVEAPAPVVTVANAPVAPVERRAVAAAGSESTTVQEPEGTAAQVVTPLSEFDPPQIFVDVSPSIVAVEAGLGGGSGFFVDAAGHVVTNYHVVQGQGNVTVVAADGERSPAEVLGFDIANDLAVLRVDPDLVRVVPLTLADSDAIVVGEPVVAIGNPFGLQTSLTTGVVSAIERTRPGLAVDGRPQRGLIQTDAAINPGNSGGALLNASGEVIGVTASVESPVRGSVGVGFAIPSNTVSRFLPAMIAGETILHPWMGIQGGLGEDAAGPTVGAVVPGGPSDQAGLRGGDVLLSVDGTSLRDFETLARFLDGRGVGDRLIFQVDRDGDVITTVVELEAWPG